jgi:Flp pilus assembly protein TadD
MTRLALLLVLVALLVQPADARRRATGAAALRDPVRLVEMGRKLEAQGDLANAANFYERALNIDARSALALEAAGDNALRRGDGAAAFGYFAGWASQNQNNARAMFGLGTSLILRQQPDEALPVLARALDLGAPRGAVAAQKGLALDLLGQQRDAQIAYAEALAADPADRASVQRMALSLAISGDRAAALRLMGRFADDTASVDVRRTLATVHALVGSLDVAGEIGAATLPPDQARAVAAFHAGLSRLSPAQKAAAVHFGRVAGPALAAAMPPPDATPPPPEGASISDTPQIWVQVLSTPNRASLAGEWRRISRDAGAAVDGLGVSVQPTGTTNRLLLGPLPDARAASALVQKLAQRKVAAVVNRTAAGTPLEPLGLP